MEMSVDPMLVLGKAVDMSVSIWGGDFPLGALPFKIQRIVREAHDCYGYPVDYLAGAMLVAVGLGIGNTHFARLKGKWDESAILFMALVGRPGACKSHPLNFAIDRSPSWTVWQHAPMLRRVRNTNVSASCLSRSAQSHTLSSLSAKGS